jgi:hypothetical protein
LRTENAIRLWGWPAIRPSQTKPSSPAGSLRSSTASTAAPPNSGTWTEAAEVRSRSTLTRTLRARITSGSGGAGTEGSPGTNSAGPAASWATRISSTTCPCWVCHHTLVNRPTSLAALSAAGGTASHWSAGGLTHSRMRSRLPSTSKSICATR